MAFYTSLVITAGKIFWQRNPSKRLGNPKKRLCSITIAKAAFHIDFSSIIFVDLLCMHTLLLANFLVNTHPITPTGSIERFTIQTTASPANQSGKAV